jgi:hypothetical protein
MVTIFHGTDKRTHDAYQTWRQDHPDGFVLSESSMGKFTLHWAQDAREHGAGRGCHHLGGSRNPFRGDKNGCYTTKRKVCSESPTELLYWAAENNYVVKNCLHCNTQKFPFPSSAITSSNPAVEKSFEELVAASRLLSGEDRARRLAIAPTKPERLSILATVFKRNPDVVAEVLQRAGGVCEECKMPAPFLRAGTNEPYLEVHHRVPLAQGGDDTVANAIALCPNCHRKAHYG